MVAKGDVNTAEEAKLKRAQDNVKAWVVFTLTDELLNGFGVLMRRVCIRMTS